MSEMTLNQAKKTVFIAKIIGWTFVLSLVAAASWYNIFAGAFAVFFFLFMRIGGWFAGRLGTAQAMLENEETNRKRRIK